MSGGGASYNAGNLSPISSEGGYSQHSASEQQAPSRPPKILDDGPLIPPQQPLAGHGQARQMYSSPNEYGGQGTLTPLAPIQEVRYSLETDTGYRVCIPGEAEHSAKPYHPEGGYNGRLKDQANVRQYSPTPSPRPSHQNLNVASPQRKITGPRPMGSRSPSGHRSLNGNEQTDLQHSDTVIRRKPIAGKQFNIHRSSYMPKLIPHSGHRESGELPEQS